jgi:hypothetical protein
MPRSQKKKEIGRGRLCLKLMKVELQSLSLAKILSNVFGKALALAIFSSDQMIKEESYICYVGPRNLRFWKYSKDTYVTKEHIKDW